jgi:hypothetical protein
MPPRMLPAATSSEPETAALTVMAISGRLVATARTMSPPSALPRWSRESRTSVVFDSWMPATQMTAAPAGVSQGRRVAPGHRTVLAHREDGVPVLGLPGNPFAGLIALIALGLPLPAGLVGSPPPPMLPRVAARPSAGPPSGARLVAVSECAEGIVPVERQGPAMTCGLVDADSIAVIETSGIDEGASARTLSLPLSR